MTHDSPLCRFPNLLLGREFVTEETGARGMARWPSVPAGCRAASPEEKLVI